MSPTSLPQLARRGAVAITLGVGALLAVAAGPRLFPTHALAAQPAPVHIDAPGRYQMVVTGGRGWIILDTQTGDFEHWVPAEGSRYHVFRCHYGRDCPITEKRSVDRGLDP